MNNRPILHISVCCQGSSQIKKELWRKMSVFSHRYNNDPDAPLIDISMDSLDSQEERHLLLNISGQRIITTKIRNPIKNTDNLYMAFTAFTNSMIQSLREKDEKWLLISITKTDNDAYDIQSTAGHDRN